MTGNSRKCQSAGTGANIYHIGVHASRFHIVFFIFRRGNVVLSLHMRNGNGGGGGGKLAFDSGVTALGTHGTLRGGFGIDLDIGSGS